MSTSRHLGTGWAFPVVPARGPRRLEYVRGPDTVAQAIWIILDTEPGERIMRPGFGCGLRGRFLMQPNTVATRALIRHEVEVALGTWEPRIELTSVDVLPDDLDPALVLVAIRYVHRRDSRPDNLVYPFFLE